MKKFNFRLERLLELRIYNEKAEESKVAHVTSQLNKVKKKLIEIALEQEVVIPQKDIGNQLAHLQARELFVNRLRQQENILLTQKEDLVEELSLAMNVYQEAKQKRMVIDKLRERNFNVYRSFQLRNQFIEEDDLNTKRYWQKKKISENRID